MNINLDLTIEEYNTMTLMCGYAAGAAVKAGEMNLARSFLHIANRLHEGNPNFTPYEEEAESTA